MSMTQRYAGMLRRNAGEWDKLEMPVQAECLRQAARHMEEREQTLAYEIATLRAKLAASEARAERLDAMLEHRADEAAETERMLRAEYVNAESRAEETRRLYDELLYQVSMKYPGESRHQTALRYLRLAETHVSGPAFTSLREEVKP